MHKICGENIFRDFFFPPKNEWEETIQSEQITVFFVNNSIFT